MKKTDQDRRRTTSGKREKGPEPKNPVMIKGIILPVDWDAEGRTTALVLSTCKENEYLITPDEKSLELMAFLRKEVKITGQIEKVNNRKYVTVKGYCPA